jgi:hypothetical protein
MPSVVVRCIIKNVETLAGQKELAGTHVVNECRAYNLILVRRRVFMFAVDEYQTTHDEKGSDKQSGF